LRTNIAKTRIELSSKKFIKNKLGRNYYNV
jgi:hypothetical protein